MNSIAQQISQELLPRVERPGQYIGLEINARNKDMHRAQVTVAMAFPDTYAIGISHLGSQLLYHRLNDMPAVACDRTYCPQTDAETVMRERGVPLFGWESRCPLGQFDIVGFSLPYEICVTNVLTMLDLAGIPLRSSQRRDGHPIIVAGDAIADAPEPMAAFIDLFIVGEGEEPLAALATLVGRLKADGASRQQIILEAARTIPSVYAPCFYEPRYNADGTLAALRPTRDDVPATIERACLKDFAASPTPPRPLTPLSEGIQERAIVEIMRGCPNACRFCQAGSTRLPVRFRSVEDILQAARDAVAATGHREIGLLSLSTSDYPRLGELIDRLSAEFTPQKVSISLPSLRVDSQLRELPKLTSEVRKGGLTIAAEAGSERLRRAIRKNITEEDMIEGVRSAYAAGWRSVKVYFIAGLPGETEQDIDEIYHLCRRLSDVRKQVDNQRGSITASVSWFVPKPHTPMQWAPMRDGEYFWAVRNRLRELAQRSPITFRFHWIERSLLEGVLCRGDRRVGELIEAAWRNGARLDAWDEHWDWAKWTAALEQTGLDRRFYAQREIPVGETLPWAHIRTWRGPDVLAQEYQAMRDVLAENPPAATDAGTPAQ